MKYGLAAFAVVPISSRTRSYMDIDWAAATDANDTSAATTRAQGERRATPADRREGIEFIVAVSGNWLKRIVIGAELVSRLTPRGLCRAAGARLL